MAIYANLPRRYYGETDPLLRLDLKLESIAIYVNWPTRYGDFDVILLSVFD